MRSIKVAIRILCALLLTFSGICSQGQTHYPSEETQQKMLTEQCAFLANMKPGLQHTQMLAVRAAMKGDDAALVQIRQSRTKHPRCPMALQPLSPLPIFACSLPQSQLLASVNYCFTCMAVVGVLAASTAVHAFVLHWL